MHPHTVIRLLPCLCAVGLVLGWGAVPAGAALPPFRASEAGLGTEGNNTSASPAVSADGRFVAFESSADNLVASDTNNCWDVFVADRKTGAVSRLSLSDGGVQGNEDSFRPAISADGRYVTFMSHASNLVPHDRNSTKDIFLVDRTTWAVTRISMGENGAEANNASDMPAMSADGRCIAFQSRATNLVMGDTNGVADIFVCDRQSGVTTRVSISDRAVEANNSSERPCLSGDGRYVAFASQADNLVAKDQNGAADIFVYDRQTKTIARVSVADKAVEGNGASLAPSISADGRYVAFVSRASNLVPNDTNGAPDIFVHDRVTGTTQRVSVNSKGQEANGESEQPCISANGKSIVFASRATNLAAIAGKDTWEIYRYDREDRTTAPVSLGSGEKPANGDCDQPACSGDARFIAFVSYADNLGSVDRNDVQDVYLYDLQPALAQSGEGRSACKAVLANQTVLLPLRPIADWLEATITYQAKTAQLTMRWNKQEALFKYRVAAASLGGQAVTLDPMPMERNNMGYVPQRLLTEGFGLEVTYDSQRAEALIRTPNGRTLRLGLEK